MHNTSYKAQRKMVLPPKHAGRCGPKKIVFLLWYEKFLHKKNVGHDFRKSSVMVRSMILN